MNDFADTFEGSGTFIEITNGKGFKKIDNQFLINDCLYDKSDLDKAFGHRMRYDNHNDLINLVGVVGYIPAICLKITQKKKSVYATFLDYSSEFDLLMKGKRLIDNKWIDVNHNFELNKAYILKCESNPLWPDELKVIGFREMKKPD